MTPRWRAVMDAVPEPTTPADALARIEAALIDENDCSMFRVTVSGGSDPVTVTATPDQVRRIFAYLGRSS
jgi:hypothetical protein